MNKRIQRKLLWLPFSQVLSTPISASLTYRWNLGSILGVVLIRQLVTGILLVMLLTSSAAEAFQRVEYIIREVQRGWILRIFHFNGASLLFVCLYYHIGRGITLGSFRLWKVWSTGIVLFFIVIAEALLGYVILWGQISVWGASVITILFRVIPFVGERLVLWIWGGLIVNRATLGCLLALHYLLPLVILVVIVIHILFLHETGRTRRGRGRDREIKIRFWPLFIVKDIINIRGYLLFGIFCLLLPFSLGDPENFKEANLIISPVHIQPEWYFLFVYAILRAVPRKVGGVLALAASLVFIWLLRSSFWKPQTNETRIFRILTSLIGASVIILTWLGASPVEYPLIGIRQIFTFIYLFILMRLWVSRFLVW